MATIASIKYCDDCITVEFDGGESLKIPVGVSAQFTLSAGAGIDDEGYRLLKEESRRYLCRLSALDYLAIRARSTLEMDRYLTRKGYDSDMIRETTAALTEAGYLDDADYAARYINARLQKKLVGKDLLASELQKRGISRQVIRQALHEASSRFGSVDGLYEIAMKKFTTLKDKKNGLVKLAQFLRRRGFDGETIAAVIERIRTGESE